MLIGVVERYLYFDVYSLYAQVCVRLTHQRIVDITLCCYHRL
jgi:hypothetical protein